MKAEITLNLRTREVYKLFERKISGDRLFIEAILHKINSVMGRCRRQDPLAVKTLQAIEQDLHSLIQKFSSETRRFEGLLSKKKGFKDKHINFIVQFHPKITIYNPLCMKLADLIEIYDQLIGILKLLRLTGSFDTDEVYFINIKSHQMLANQLLSKILLQK